MSTSPRPDHRLAARAAGFVVAFVVVLAGAATAAPGAWWAPFTATGCAGAATSSHAGLVVDFGTVTDAGTIPSPSLEVSCVPLTTSAETGSDVLIAAGHTLSFDSRTGLLCSIDGYPSSGCGKATGGGYEYWSYWHGGSSWTYATSGPDFTRVQPGGVEGWRFVAGRDSSSEHAPRYSSRGPCPTPSTTTTGRVVTPTTAPSAGRSGGSGGGHSTTATSVDRVGGVTSSTTRGAGASTRPTSGAADPSAGHGSSGSHGASGADSSTEATGSSRALAASAVRPRRPGSGSPVAAIAVGGLILALAAGAFAVSRLRSVP